MRRHGWLLGWSLALTLAASHASAQGGAGGRLNLFDAAETGRGDLALSRARDVGHGRLGVLLSADYANDPLVYERRLGDAGSERAAVVGDQLDVSLTVHASLWNRLLFFVGLQVTAWMDGDDVAAFGVPSADGAGFGALRFGVRGILLGAEPEAGFGLALQLTGVSPALSASAYRADEAAALHPELLLEGDLGSLRLVLNGGVLVRRDAAQPGSNLAFEDQITFGLGAALPLAAPADETERATELMIQVHGRTALGDPGRREALALEALGGLRLPLGEVFSTTLGGGLGLTRGMGAPDARVVLQLAAATPREKPPQDTDGDGLLDPQDDCPRRAEDRDGFEDADGCPDPDNDGDGILDADDQCRDEPETQNGHEDEDGCPDEVPDSDGDGLKDDVDKCPGQPEDRDGYEDEDGCPDPDNDGDGVVDTADACPVQPGPVENRGCPDTDRDGDGVVDRLDNCPDEPGSADNHGCKKRQRVVIRQDKLEILDKVYFRFNSDRIQRRSYPLLLNVARVLNAHPEIKKVRVEGHTDSRGSREYNLALSQRRAEAVVRFLVERGGVDAARLEAKGFGPDKPIVPEARTRADHARNRRVEFNIVEFEPVVQVVDGAEAGNEGRGDAASGAAGQATGASAPTGAGSGTETEQQGGDAGTPTEDRGGESAGDARHEAQGGAR